MVLVGGLGTVFGPAVGAVIIIAMQNYLAQVGEWVTVIQGVIFVTCVLLFRRGVVGEIARLLPCGLKPTVNTLEKPSLTLKRRLKAPPATVFAAWIEPKQIAKW